MRVCFLLLMCCSLLAAFGQTNNNKKSLRFSSHNQAGLLEGEKGSAFLLQSVNGVQYKGWFTGIGVGLDYYRFRGVPLFLDVRKSLLKERSHFFLYADAGIHFPWIRDKERIAWQQSEFTTGLYVDAGVQYLWRLSEANAVSFSIGYTEKKISEVVLQNNIQCVMPPCFEHKQQFDYRLKRISMKAGFTF